MQAGVSTHNTYHSTTIMRPSMSVYKTTATAEKIVTPLKLDNWIRAMAAYPDPQFVVSGIQQWFWIWLQYGLVHYNLAKANAKSASLHPKPIS